MKQVLVTLAAAAILLSSAAAWGQELDRVDRTDRDRQGGLQVDVWLDNGDGVYYEGENVAIHFRADRDCFVAIYSIDTRGDVELLYPTNRWDDGSVRGGEDYSIPGRNADYNLVVNGPEGIEHIQAVASLSNMDIPDWYDGAPIRCDYRDNREEFVDYVNQRYFGCRWDNCVRAFSGAAIYVKVPRYYYRPVYVPDPWNTCPDYGVVYIDYPFGGEIYVDGIFFGIAPLWIPRVMIGWHWMTIYDRYGYCWEDHIDVYNHNTIYLDRTRVKTSRTVVSRFNDKEIRAQAKKYDRTSFVKSEERVKSTRLDGNEGLAKKSYRPNVRGSDNPQGYSTKRAPEGRDESQSSRKYDGNSERSRPGWNEPTQKTKRDGEGGRQVTREAPTKATGESTGSRRYHDQTGSSSTKRETAPSPAKPGYQAPSGSSSKGSGNSGTVAPPKKSSGGNQSSGKSSGGSSGSSRKDGGDGNSGGKPKR